MTESPHVLLADDDETFLRVTDDLLRRQGYRCTAVTDGLLALKSLDDTPYDLLITDIKMPGNLNLELVKQIAETAQGMPVILVTGYPSVETAIRSLDLPVVAYLIKPFDFQDLLVQVESSIERYRLYKAIGQSRSRLANWSEELALLENQFVTAPRDGAYVSVDAYLGLVIKNILNSLTDIKHLAATISERTPSANACALFECPRLSTLSAAVEEATVVLENTKGAFKSKVLGQLRRRLEGVVRETSDVRAKPPHSSS